MFTINRKKILILSLCLFTHHLFSSRSFDGLVSYEKPDPEIAVLEINASINEPSNGISRWFLNDGSVGSPLDFYHLDSFPIQHLLPQSDKDEYYQLKQLAFLYSNMSEIERNQNWKLPADWEVIFETKSTPNEKQFGSKKGIEFMDWYWAEKVFIIKLSEAPYLVLINYPTDIEDVAVKLLESIEYGNVPGNTNKPTTSDDSAKTTNLNNDLNQGVNDQKNESVLLSQKIENSELASNWFQSDWLGTFCEKPDSSWIYHTFMGWIYTGSIKASPENLWLYKQGLGWLWTSEESYPWLYSDKTKFWVYLNLNEDIKPKQYFDSFDDRFWPWNSFPDRSNVAIESKNIQKILTDKNKDSKSKADDIMSEIMQGLKW